MSLLSPTLATAALLLAWLALGWTVLRPVRSALQPSERLSLAVLAGAGTMGVGLFVTGQLRFSPLVVAAFAATACLPLWSDSERAALAETWREIRMPALPVALPLAALFAVLFVAGLAVPVGDMGNDGISYHLAGPVVWLRDHRIVPALDMSPHSVSGRDRNPVRRRHCALERTRGGRVWVGVGRRGHRADLRPSRAGWARAHVGLRRPAYWQPAYPR